jgi:hypothetical protein
MDQNAGLCQRPNETGYLFELFVEDDRYAVPTLRLLVAADVPCARKLAAEVLEESAHHTGVEVRLGDRRVAGLGACA